MFKFVNGLLNASKPAWTQYKNVWKSSPKKAVAKHIAGGGVLGGLLWSGYYGNVENVSKAQKERPVGDVHWGKANPKEDWLDRSANFVRKHNPFVAITADRALSYSAPNKVDYDKHGWFTKNYPAISEFINSYGHHLNGWGTMMERGGRRAVADFAQGYSNVGYALPALLSGGMRAAGKIFGNNALRHYGDKLRSWTLANYKNDYDSWEDFGDNSYSKNNYSSIAPEVYQSFRALEQPVATAINSWVTKNSLNLPGKFGSMAATANTMDDVGIIPGLGLAYAQDEQDEADEQETHR